MGDTTDHVIVRNVKDFWGQAVLCAIEGGKTIVLMRDGKDIGRVYGVFYIPDSEVGRWYRMSFGTAPARVGDVLRWDAGPARGSA